ncbi:MAG: UDP-N-acetylglucosamine 2-epimerase (non-hydrolyzing) [Chloroflexi bacterium]|nr:UDP-N-acetylglucosamine 2-epimerase (non-hydrolyzing) [Chloroflexota bacterium]
MKVLLVCGARPNFMKISPLIRAIDRHNFSGEKPLVERVLVHTGQHYDYQMSELFFQELELPRPDVHLGVGSGTHAEQTGKVMLELEKVLVELKPDMVIVVGDVNSTLAAALAAVKLHIKVAHVEAGLRSYDKSMPEEINRVLTDHISDYLFTPSRDADENLIKEGIPREKVFFVGDVMVDSLLYNRKKASQRRILDVFNLREGNYALLTLHRPSNVDDKENLSRLVEAIYEMGQQLPIIFLCHPRTRINIEKFGLISLFQMDKSAANSKGVLLTEPLGYLDCLRLMMDSAFVMTDSGGMQEETTVLNVPCLTLRDTTERPITITQGTNTLVGNDTRRMKEEANAILEGRGKKGIQLDFWDGKAAERIMDVLIR